MKITIFLIIVVILTGAANFLFPTLPGISEIFLAALGLLLAAAGKEANITKQAEKQLGEKFWKKISL